MIEVAINVRERSGNHKSKRIPATFFDEVHLSMRFDSVASTFKLGLKFDPFNPDHAELACVTHIHECEIEEKHDNGTRERLITGFMLSQGFSDGPKEELMSIGGYSKCGMLQDCDIPTSCPLESNGLTFRQVVKQVVDAMNSVRRAGHFTFKIKSSRADTKIVVKEKKSEDTSGVMALIAEIEGKADAVIPKTTAKESKNALSYLKEIAIQKRLILSHDELGNLVVGVPNTGKKYLFTFDATKETRANQHITDMKMVFDGQRAYSHITVIRQADVDGGNYAEFTIENPLVPIVYRPKVVILSSGDDITIDQAARNELGNALKGATLKIELDRWVINNKFIRPNNPILICDPKLYLYEPTEWFIEQVDYDRNPNEEKCTLTCVLPYCYNNATPVNPFVKPGENTPLDSLL